jgi:type IV secretory pathway TraG/TraD family ATPase VirD4
MSQMQWGPSHQTTGEDRRRKWAIRGAIFLVYYLLVGYRQNHMPASGGTQPWLWALGVMFKLGLLAAAIAVLVAIKRSRTVGLLVGAYRRHRAKVHHAVIVVAGLRKLAARCGGGAYLGADGHGQWVCAHYEQAVLVLGPPRSGKTTGVVIPSVLTAPGAVLCTSTKTDVLALTAQARSQLGQTWLYDPSGTTQCPPGVRRLCWSPVSAADTWDGALLMARAMCASSPASKGTTHESHWTERSAALLAPMLYAAYLSGRPIADVLSWVLRQDLDPAGLTLEEHRVRTASEMLLGIAKTDGRERSSIFSAAAGVLSAFNLDGPREQAQRPNLDAHEFVSSSDTIYVTAPAAHQAACAPLVVGLIEQLRNAAYERSGHGSRSGWPPVTLLLDELANIAPLPDLPALVSEGGGQGTHNVALMQDLSQGRARWGSQVADGFLSLFQTKLVLPGIADTRTLQAISLAIGEYDRRLVTHTNSSTKRDGWFAGWQNTQGTSVHTHRQPTLSPGDIATIPTGYALLLQGTSWRLIRATPSHTTPPFDRVIGR